LTLSREIETPETQRSFGLMRTLINNNVVGVSEGFERQLEINGVGFRAAVAGNVITLALGFSHPVVFTLPEGVDATIEKNIITLKGFDKQLVGQVAANLRSLKKPEPYKGKGIKYVEEHIRRKAGKTAAKG
jgi:large subunit ribosomal protein L6